MYYTTVTCQLLIHGNDMLFSVNSLGDAVLFSGDALAYIIVVAGKISEVTIKNTNKLGIRFIISFYQGKFYLMF